MAPRTKERQVKVPIIDKFPQWQKAEHFNQVYSEMQLALIEKYPKSREGDLLVPKNDLQEALRGLGDALDQRIIVPRMQMHPMWIGEGEQSDARPALTANSSKLLQEPERLKRIYTGEAPSPLTLHLTLTQVCNATCTRCCCANRAFNEVLLPDQAVKALTGFALLGTPEVEFTGGGEPTTARYFAFMVMLARALDYEKIGVITNGTLLDKLPPIWDNVNWTRVGIYNHELPFPNIEVLKDAGVNVSAGHIFGLSEDDAESQNFNIIGGHHDANRKISPEDKRPTMKTFLAMLDWIDEKAQIPVRIVPDAIRPREAVLRDTILVQEILDNRYQQRRVRISASGGDPNDVVEYAFVADTSNKIRQNDACYMAMFKPEVTTESILGAGKVVVCPCFAYAPENQFSHRKPEFKVCAVDDIVPYYEQGPKRRHQTCSVCQFAGQNGIIDAMLIPTSQE